MSAKYGIPVCPHAGGVGLCEYVVCSPITTTETDTEEDVDPSLADRLYLRVWKYGAERPGVCRVRFPYFFDTGVDGYQPLARTLPLPCLHQRSRSIQVSHLPLPGKAAQTDGLSVPTDPKGGYSIEMYEDSLEEFAFPGGAYWLAAARGQAPPPHHRTAGQTVH